MFTTAASYLAKTACDASKLTQIGMQPVSYTHLDVYKRQHTHTHTHTHTTNIRTNVHIPLATQAHSLLSIA